MSETMLTHGPDEGCRRCPLSATVTNYCGEYLGSECRLIAREHITEDDVPAPAECPLRNGGRVVVQAGKRESDA